MAQCCSTKLTEKLDPANDIRENVRKVYGSVARNIEEPGGGCCGATKAGLDPGVKNVISSGLYSESELEGVPLVAQLASLGCGNPTALAELQPGETVLDLGSGAGIDVLISARRVGPTGMAYGLDMTDEMLELAEKNRIETGLTNVRFLKGEIENIPLPDKSVNTIISNCVINLSVDKRQVIAEAARVLKPGGLFAVSDIVFADDLDIPESARADLQAWSGCISGALTLSQYEQLLSSAGFTNVTIIPTRYFSREDIVQAGFQQMLDKLSPEQLDKLDNKIMSAFIRASLPGGV